MKLSLWLLGIATAFVFAALPSIAHATEKRYGCYWIPERAAFFFDDVELAPFTSAYLNGRLHDFATKEARMRVTLLDFPLFLLAPTRLLDLCDWWPDQLTWAMSGGTRVFLSERGGGPVPGQSVLWLATELRWYVWPELFAGYGWQHYSFGGFDSAETVKYIRDHKIDVADVAPRDIMFLRLALQVPHGRLKGEYYVIRNLWEANLVDMFNSLVDTDKRKSYAFPIAGGFKISYPLISVMDVALSGSAEYSEKKTPYSAEAALDLFRATRQDRGLTIFYRYQAGNGKNVARTGWHGLEMDGAFYGIRMFLESF